MSSSCGCNCLAATRGGGFAALRDPQLLARGVVAPPDHLLPCWVWVFPVMLASGSEMHLQLRKKRC